MSTITPEALPEVIRRQIDAMATAPETPKLPDIKERLAANWSEKFELFVSQTRLLDMDQVPSLPAADRRGLIALTYSGSLVAIGPQTGSGRWLEYSSIKLRADVPEIVSGQRVEIKGGVGQDAALEFESGPIKSTSAVYRIAVCDARLSPEEQDRRIREAAIYLTNGFMKINRGLSEKRERSADQFTIKGMASYIARKNGLTAVLVKQVLDDLFATAETGLLLGERVSLGKLGTMSLKIKRAQKARLVKNPLTKVDILVPAKPASALPRLSIPTALRAKTAALDTDKL